MKIASICVSLINLILFLAETYLIVIIIMQMLMVVSLSLSLSLLTVPGSGQNWMEVAYGTRAGKVRVVVRHPENIGQAPQIFQTYSVHTCPIMRVVLGEKHLISGKKSTKEYF